MPLKPSIYFTLSTSRFRLATFQVLSHHIWLVVAILDVESYILSCLKCFLVQMGKLRPREVEVWQVSLYEGWELDLA